MRAGTASFQPAGLPLRWFALWKQWWATMDSNRLPPHKGAITGMQWGRGRPPATGAKPTLPIANLAAGWALASARQTRDLLSLLFERLWVRRENMDQIETYVPRGEYVFEVMSLVKVRIPPFPLEAQDRPYQRAVPTATALDILTSEAGEGKLDADLLDIFISKRVYEVTATR